MVTVYLDNMNKADAQDLFDFILEREYVSNAECNINPNPRNECSVRVEAYEGSKLFSDLEKFFSEAA